VYISLCTTVIHNTAQNSSDNFLTYPPDNHHSSDDVYWRGGRTTIIKANSNEKPVAKMKDIISKVNYSKNK